MPRTERRIEKKRVIARVVIDVPEGITTSNINKANGPVVQSIKTANQALQHLGKKQIQFDELNQKMNAEFAKISQKYFARLQTLDHEIQTCAHSLINWANLGREELLAQERGKKVEFEHGFISWRARPDTLEIEGGEKGENAIVSQLIDLDEESYLREVTTLDKHALLARPQILEELEGIQIVSRPDYCIVKAKLSNKEVKI